MSNNILAAQRAGLIRDICEHPQRDDLRLIFADWCEDHGEPERAEFVRLQIEYAGLHGHYEAHDTDYLDCPDCIRAGIIEGVLKTRFRIGRNEHPTWARDCPSVIMQTKPTGPAIEWQWHRGFVENITCSWLVWEKHASGLVECHPIQRVTLADKRPTTGQFNAHHQNHKLRDRPYWRWLCQSLEAINPDPWELPEELYLLLDTAKCAYSAMPMCYLSEQDARDTLSLACVNFARKKVGLPMIQP